MHIQNLTAFHTRIPLRKPIKHASHSRTENDTLVIRCTLDDGTIGWGEGLPRPYVTGETIETTFDQLQATDLKTQLDTEFTELCDVVNLCETLKLSGGDAAKRDCFGNALRCAIEVSILDAVTRRLGVPFSAVVDQVPETEPIRESRDEVFYSAVLTAMKGRKELIRCIKIRYWGFHQCKVKVGVEGHNDVKSFKRIRRIMGKKIDLRVDANEAWNCQNLEQKIATLERFRISSVEQPIPHEQVNGLAMLRPKLSVPIMLDESLCSFSDGERAIEHGLCDLFNLRLSKCGGFIRTLKLAALAYQAGLGYQLGCQVGETAILSAAGRHFATSISGIRFLEGSFDRLLVSNRLIDGDITFHRKGQAPALTEPGLGVNVDPQKLEEVIARQEEFPIR